MVITPPATHSFSDGEAMVEAAMCGLGLIQMPLSILREHIDSRRLRQMIDQLASKAAQGYFNSCKDALAPIADKMTAQNGNSPSFPPLPICAKDPAQFGQG